MTQRLITHLRHVDLAVPDYQTQLDFYTNAWGLKAEHDDSGLSFLAAEGSPEQYVVRLRDRKSTRLNSSHANISYAVFCLKKKKNLLPSYALKKNHLHV